MSYTSETAAATLFSQFHRLVLHEIAAHLPTDILQNLITVIKPNWHLKTELLDVMYMRMSDEDSKYLVKFPAAKTMPLNTSYGTFLQLHLLSDANLCRVRWIVDLTYNIRKKIPEARALLQYMENDSEDREEPSLQELARCTLSYENFTASICQAYAKESGRRLQR